MLLLLMGIIDFYKNILSKHFWYIEVRGNNGIKNQFFVSYYINTDSENGLLSTKDVISNKANCNKNNRIIDGKEMNNLLYYYNKLYDQKFNIPSRKQLNILNTAVEYDNKIPNNIFINNIYEISSYNGSCLTRCCRYAKQIEGDQYISYGFTMRLVYNL